MAFYNLLIVLLFLVKISLPSQLYAGTMNLRLAIDGVNRDRHVDVVSVPGAPDKVALLGLRDGAIRIYDRRTGTLDTSPLLTGVTIPDADLINTLSLAFAPDFQTSGKVYVSVVASAPGNRNQDSNRVLEYIVNPSTMIADPASRRTVIRIDHPVDEIRIAHHGSDLNFGPTDGMLYITTGDSQVALPGTVGAPATNPSQDVTNRLGAVLRVDLSGDAYPADPDNNYAIPADNPDFGPGADPSLWAIGLRNPFRASFSALTGQLIIADVGEDRFEEINIGVAGANYGWPAFEGDAAFLGAVSPAGVLTGPAYAYGHGGGAFDGISITGGVVYFGDIGALYGRYIFGDYSLRDGIVSLWTVALDAGGVATDPQVWSYEVDGGVFGRPFAFGAMEDGAVFMLGDNGDVFELTGVSVPVPAAAGLLASGVGLLAGLRLMRRSKRRARWPAGRFEEPR